MLSHVTFDGVRIKRKGIRLNFFEELGIDVGFTCILQKSGESLVRGGHHRDPAPGCLSGRAFRSKTSLFWEGSLLRSSSEIITPCITVTF